MFFFHSFSLSISLSLSVCVLVEFFELEKCSQLATRALYYEKCLHLLPIISNLFWHSFKLLLSDWCDDVCNKFVGVFLFKIHDNLQLFSVIVSSFIGIFVVVAVGGGGGDIFLFLSFPYCLELKYNCIFDIINITMTHSYSAISAFDSHRISLQYSFVFIKVYFFFRHISFECWIKLSFTLSLCSSSYHFLMVQCYILSLSHSQCRWKLEKCLDLVQGNRMTSTLPQWPHAQHRFMTIYWCWNFTYNYTWPFQFTTFNTF